MSDRESIPRYQTRVKATKIYPADDPITRYTSTSITGTLAADLEENYPMIIYEEDPVIEGSGIVTSRIVGLVGKGKYIYVHTQNSIYQLEELEQETSNGA